jgi:tetratricopeptide (TPR) repeat protein
MENKELQQLVQQAEALCEKKKYREALPIGEELVSKWPDEMLPYYIRGRARWGMKAYSDALVDIDKALAQSPDFAKAWHYKGNALGNLKRYEESLACYDHAIQIDPNYAYAFNGKGNVLTDMNRYEEALRCYDRALGIDSKYTSAYNGKGNVLANTKRYEEALGCYDRALGIDPEFAYAYNGKGNVLDDMKRYEEALECYDRALGIDSKYANAYNGKGNILAKTKRYVEALECYDRALGIDPEFAYAYNGKGNILAITKRYVEALECYDRALGIDSKNADAYNGKGNVLDDMKRYEEALECYDRALGIDSKYANAYNGKGNVYLDMMRYEEALQSFTQAINIEEDALFFQNRARLFVALDRYREALKDYNRSIKIEPDNEYAKFLRRRLQEKYYRNHQTKRTEKEQEEKPAPKEEWKKRAERAVERFKAEDESSGEFPGGETLDLDSSMIRRIQQFHQNREQKRTEKAVEDNQQSFKQFTNDQHMPDNLHNLEFYVLRRWNSYTPIISHNNGSSKGGGYFLYMGASGVVIDPGFNFIENFQEFGFNFSQIGKVFISHAHNDHDADLESILTLLHVYNKDVNERIAEKLVQEVLNGEFPDNEIQTEDAIFQYMKKENDSRYGVGRKVIDLYLTTGVFKKHATMLELRRYGEYRVHIINPEEEPIKVGKDVTIRPICAKHYDLMSDCDAVGFVIEFPEFALVYTGDTGYSPEIGKRYSTLRDELSKKKSVALLAHIGGFKSQERATNVESISNGKAFYNDHLGRNGLICLVDALRPHCCIISEFGEEFNGFREQVANLFTRTFEKFKIRFLPADIGLCMNSNMMIWAINKVKYGRNKKPKLEKDFIDPSDSRAILLENGCLTYHNHDLIEKKEDVNSLRLEIETAYKTGEQRRPAHKPLS